MDWNAAIERQREALRSILAAIVIMAGGEAGTLPRRMHRAVLRLLRPAESAARRLVIALARDLTAPPPPPRYARSPSSASQGRIGVANGTTWILPRSRGRGTAVGGGGGVPRAPLQRLALPLLDPLSRDPWAPARRYASAGVPRISVPGLTRLFPVAVRRPPLPDDPIDVARLRLRLRALAAALDDLPREARRFARWRARSQHASPAPAGGRGAAHTRFRRVWPLRPGGPPGGHAKSVQEVHEVLKEAHWLALTALERRDTS